MLVGVRYEGLLLFESHFQLLLRSFCVPLRELCDQLMYEALDCGGVNGWFADFLPPKLEQHSNFAKSQGAASLLSTLSKVVE